MVLMRTGFASRVTKVAAALVLVPSVTASVGAQPTAAARSNATSSEDEAAVREVLSYYKAAIESLDTTGTERLFTADSQVFETGGVEGGHKEYLSHHLGPELKAFKAFRFSDYKVNVRSEGSVALATETYKYRIETKKGEVVERLGVATSVLRKENGQWKIAIMHNSSRRLKVS